VLENSFFVRVCRVLGLHCNIWGN